VFMELARTAAIVAERMGVLLVVKVEGLRLREDWLCVRLFVRDVRSVEGRKGLFMYDWRGWRRYLKLLGKD
jgi:hypothetical protein